MKIREFKVAMKLTLILLCIGVLFAATKAQPPVKTTERLVRLNGEIAAAPNNTIFM